MATTDETALLDLTRRLLDSITGADWDTYLELCDPTLTAFEPEALGQRVEGLDFHHFYFKLAGGRAHHNTTVSSPHVRLMGDAAVVTYIRLSQRETPAGPATVGFEETRVWQKRDGAWKHVHFHRSPLPASAG